jgi:hypothetical protein
MVETNSEYKHERGVLLEGDEYHSQGNSGGSL